MNGLKYIGWLSCAKMPQDGCDIVHQFQFPDGRALKFIILICLVNTGDAVKQVGVIYQPIVWLWTGNCCAEDHPLKRARPISRLQHYKMSYYWLFPVSAWASGIVFTQFFNASRYSTLEAKPCKSMGYLWYRWWHCRRVYGTGLNCAGTGVLSNVTSKSVATGTQRIGKNFICWH